MKYLVELRNGYKVKIEANTKNHAVGLCRKQFGVNPKSVEEYNGDGFISLVAMVLFAVVVMFSFAVAGA